MNALKPRPAFDVLVMSEESRLGREAIETAYADNGVPFASAHALYGLSKLAVWWLRLGIQLERIKPGHPQQDGRHERMPSHAEARSHQSGRRQLPSNSKRGLIRFLQQFQLRAAARGP